MRFRRKDVPVDYSSRSGDRQRMTNYLRTGGFRRAGFMPMTGYAIGRNRIILCCVVLIIAVIGLYYSFF